MYLEKVLSESIERRDSFPFEEVRKRIHRDDFEDGYQRGCVDVVSSTGLDSRH